VQVPYTVIMARAAFGVAHVVLLFFLLAILCGPPEAEATRKNHSMDLPSVFTPDFPDMHIFAKSNSIVCQREMQTLGPVVQEHRPPYVHRGTRGFVHCTTSSLNVKYTA
jgi:hypothetical protein